MAQAGIPALQILANHYGITTDAMQKMVSDGAVPATEGLAAITQGIEKGSKGIAGFTPAMAGMAKGLAKGAPGALMNLGAAASRFGASLLAPIFEKAPPLLGALSGWLDTVGTAAGAVMRVFVNSAGGQKIYAKMLSGIATSAPKVAAGIVRIAGSAARLIKSFLNAPIVAGFFDRIKAIDLGDVVDKIGALGTQAKRLFDKFKASPEVTGFLDKLKSTGKGIDLDKTFAAISNVLSTKVLPVLKGLIPAGKNLLVFADHLKTASVMTGKGLFVSLIVALPAFKDLVNVLANLLAKVPPSALVALFAAFATFKVAKGAADGVNGLATSIGTAKKSLDAFGKAKDNISKVSSAIKGLPTKSLTKLKSGFETIGIKALYAKDKIKSGATAVADFGKKSATAALGIAKTVAQFVAQKAAMVGAKIAELALAAAKKVSAAAQWLLNAAMSANPITLIVIGIAALIAGFVLAYNKIGWFRDFVQAAFRVIKSVILGVFDWLKTNWPLVLAILTGPIGIAVLVITKNWDTIKAAFTAVKNWIGDRVSDIVGFITGIGGRIAGAVSTMWSGIKSGFTKAKDWIHDRVNDIVGFVTGIGDRIKDSVGKLAGIVSAPFKLAFRSIARLWNDTIGKIHFHIPGTSITIDGPKLPVPELHTGGVVPGGPSNEPLYRLQGGELVLSRDQVKALGRQSATPRGGLHIDKVEVHNGTDVDTFLQKAGWAMARGAL